MSTNYTTTIAYLEALKLGGVEVVFTNLGSDHPSFVEAIAASKRGHRFAGRALNLPEFISVPHEFVAVSAAQGYYQAVSGQTALMTGKVAGLLVHVDCGLQNLGGGIHNLWRGRVPCVVFSGLSPVTHDGELRGSRSEFIHWVQDTPDQPGIVRGYSKFTYEIRTGRNVAQVALRALQLAQTEPKGPAYIFGCREVMEEELTTPVEANLAHWQPVPPPALPQDGVQTICEKLAAAKKPLVVTSWLGKNEVASNQLVELAESLEMPVLDATPFNVNFPTNHRLYAGSQWNAPGQNKYLAEADVVLVIDTDTPWAPTANKPGQDAFLIHIDQDPLKTGMPMFFIPAELRYTASSAGALQQLNEYLQRGVVKVNKGLIDERKSENDKRHKARREALEKASTVKATGTQGRSIAAVAIAALARVLPQDHFVLSESITNFGPVMDHIGVTDARRYATSQASCLGWHGGAAVGAKYGFQKGVGRTGTDAFVCAISGDGSFLFSIPSVVQHLASKVRTPFLQVILANGGWKAPRMSALLVHPNGHAAQSSGLDIGVMFGKRSAQPDFVGLVIAAAGGPDRAWGAVVESGSPDMESTFKEAVDAVQGGKQAVVVVLLPDLDHLG